MRQGPELCCLKTVGLESIRFEIKEIFDGICKCPPSPAQYSGTGRQSRQGAAEGRAEEGHAGRGQEISRSSLPKAAPKQARLGIRSQSGASLRCSFLSGLGQA